MTFLGLMCIFEFGFSLALARIVRIIWPAEAGLTAFMRVERIEK